MATRLELQQLLRELLGSENVYFDPPSTVSMGYPAIVYKLDDVVTDHADNKPYRRAKRYLVTVIDPDPDSVIPDRVGNLPSATFVRSYKADNLHHTVNKLFF